MAINAPLNPNRPSLIIPLSALKRSAVAVLMTVPNRQAMP